MVTRAEVVEALQALDSQSLKAVAGELGYSERSLWDYRKGVEIPELRLRPLARALGLA